VRGLNQLASPENEEFSQAGWPTITSLLEGLNMQIFGNSWLAQHFRPSGAYPIEIVPIILKGRGEVLIILMGKQDGMGRVHPPMNLYGVINKRDWNDITTPREMTSRLGALASTVLQDQVARLILEMGHLILPGWTVQAESSSRTTFIRGGSSNRWRTIPSMSELSPLNISNPHAWDMRQGRHQPAELLLKGIIALIEEGTIRAGMVREGTLLLAPDRELDELLQRQIQADNTQGILDLRGASVDWETTNSILESLQQWLDNRPASTAGQHSSMEEEEEDSEDMESELTQTGDEVDSMGAAAVLLPHGNSMAKAPGHV
jgi:hypothetical protein